VADFRDMEVGRYMGAIGESNGYRFIGVVFKECEQFFKVHGTFLSSSGPTESSAEGWRA
jgi:hypothetical protein